ncbi:MAG: metallophosphoesterase [Clostridia bacterium]|nr:metallophosphoesterase [Clostridia bacterium]
MKIGIISDIHVDVRYQENDRIEDALIDVINKKGLDYLIVAGDISNDYELTLSTIDNIENKTNIRCLFVPGNHDLWNIKHKDIIDTTQIYRKYLEHESCLCRGVYKLNDEYVVIGDIGWYDYSYRDFKYSCEKYLIDCYLEKQWQDKKYINWKVSDCEKTRYFYDKLKEEMENFKDKKIIFVTHMVTHRGFLVNTSNNEKWKYFNGYLGSDLYKDLFNSNVKYVIMGHVHYRRNIEEEGIQYICRCLGYRNQWRKGRKAKEEIEETIKVIEV